MTQTIKQKSTLFDRDLNLWLEEAIAKLKAGDFQSLDVKNLIEELEGLAGRDRRELKRRLTTLIEHILKRCYVNSPKFYGAWEIEIIQQQNELATLLEQSPSLQSHFLQVFDFAFDTALKIARLEYHEANFPNVWQFSRDPRKVLNLNF
ncbi:DUF29 domain-containing protein [Pseudanabaena minima]|uniref:DUF29 domain-containing protein n=1 Tax=Pseudanabaena minima TaxID=890415 RepID=UPI003DA87671